MTEFICPLTGEICKKNFCVEVMKKPHCDKMAEAYATFIHSTIENPIWKTGSAKEWLIETMRMDKATFKFSEEEYNLYMERFMEYLDPSLLEIFSDVLSDDI